MGWSEWKNVGGTLKTLEIEVPLKTQISNTSTEEGIVRVSGTLPTGLDKNQIVVAFANIDYREVYTSTLGALQSTTVSWEYDSDTGKIAITAGFLTSGYSAYLGSKVGQKFLVIYIE